MALSLVLLLLGILFFSLLDPFKMSEGFLSKEQKIANQRHNSIRRKNQHANLKTKLDALERRDPKLRRGPMLTAQARLGSKRRNDKISNAGLQFLGKAVHNQLNQHDRDIRRRQKKAPKIKSAEGFITKKPLQYYQIE